MSYLADMPSLDKPCPQCHGTGKINNPEWIQWSKKVKESFEKVKHDDDADSIMKSFTRNNPKPETSREQVCDKCGGLGVVPTEAGWAILRFMKMFQK